MVPNRLRSCWDLMMIFTVDSLIEGMVEDLVIEQSAAQ